MSQNCSLNRSVSKSRGVVYFNFLHTLQVFIKKQTSMLSLLLCLNLLKVSEIHESQYKNRTKKSINNEVVLERKMWE